MRDASLVTYRNTSCVVDPLGMTVEEFLAGAHAAHRHGCLSMTEWAVSCSAKCAPSACGGRAGSGASRDG